jgi:hypothetical protein
MTHDPRAVSLGILLVLACAPPAVLAQQIRIDRGMHAANLWCFPLDAEPKTYVYLPSSARLATDDSGRPQFSFVRYVTIAPSAAERQSSITAATGGGILHLLVTIETPAASVAAAQAALREALKDNDVTLRGPIVFADGRYALVSSAVGQPNASPERTMLATGRAPVLEGNRLAFSFGLSPERATLLRKSMEMKTPDVSIVFDMTFTGLNESYDADLTIDWSEVAKTKSFAAGGSIYYVGADIKAAFDDMRRTNAIRLRSSGSDAAMEGLLDTVYAKLLQLMFRPVEPEQVPAAKQGGLLDALNALIDNPGALGSRTTTGFGLNVAYQLKDLRSSGLSRLNFNHRATVERHSLITFNIGDLHQRYGRDTAHFRDVSLEDPAFLQREIHVAVDGAVLPEFERSIDGVAVTLRKRHQNGQETLRELVLDRQTATKGLTGLRMVYGWNGDDDRAAWLQYDYRTRWSFRGGGAYETEWTTASGPLIDLFAPYERRSVQIVGDREALMKRQVRAVIVDVEYPFFGDRRRQSVIVRPDATGEDPRIDITLPLGQQEYDFVITWQLEGNRRLSSRGKGRFGLVFIDEVPES